MIILIYCNGSDNYWAKVVLFYENIFVISLKTNEKIEVYSKYSKCYNNFIVF